MDIAVLLKIGYVGKDYQELLAVFVAIILAMGLMVAFGAWWSR